MTKNGNSVPKAGLPGLEEGEMSIAPLEDTDRNTNLDRARQEFRPVVLDTVRTTAGTDIADLILLEHEEFRTRFTQLWGMRGDRHIAARAVAWRVLADLLEVHAKAEEEILYPMLLKRGGDEAPAETLGAIGDHNDIRDAIHHASRVASGTDFWWAAVQSCRRANDEHLAEEERDVLPDFREHTDSGLRSDLGLRWLTFHEEHRAARDISEVDVDPKEFVRENS